MEERLNYGALSTENNNPRTANIDKMDALFDDVELLKTTVAAHSVKLQQLA